MTTNPSGHGTPPNGVDRRFGTTRMEALSDGVFAISVTLLVLGLSIPPGSREDLLRAFLDQWRSYVAYTASFATIGLAWLKHSTITDYLDQVNASLMKLNLLLLLAVSFLPFPTQLLARYSGDTEAERVAVTIYGINLFVVVVLVRALWWSAVRGRMVRPDLDDVKLQVITKRLFPAFVAYQWMIVLGLFFPAVAMFGYLIITLFLILPFGLKLRASRTRRTWNRPDSDPLA